MGLRHSRVRVTLRVKVRLGLGRFRLEDLGGA